MQAWTLGLSKSMILGVSSSVVGALMASSLPHNFGSGAILQRPECRSYWMNHHPHLSLTLCILSALFSAQEGELPSQSAHAFLHGNPRQWTQLLLLVREKLNTYKMVGSLPTPNPLPIFFLSYCFHFSLTFIQLLGRNCFLTIELTILLPLNFCSIRYFKAVARGRECGRNCRKGEGRLSKYIVWNSQRINTNNVLKL